MSSQPGWHPDPVPPQPGQPAQLRYWDGSRWTEHTAPAQGPAQGGPSPYAGQYAATQVYAPAGGGKATTTPDGERLAGWWQRVLAYVVDAIAVGVVAAIIGIPWIRQIVDGYTEWFDEALDAGATGGTVDTSQLQSDLFWPMAAVLLIQLGVGLVYHVGFLVWRQATPGKMLVGLKVRLREQPGPITLGTALVRWLTQFGPSLLGIVPVVGTLTGLYALLDVLWPLWDDKKQAIHDKAAGTNVVRTR